MSYKMKHFELDKNWGLDEWPDEVSLSHKAQPSVSRKYAPIEGSVVHCRDCLNFEQDELGGYCTLLDFEDVKSMENKFCAWGDAK